MEDGYQLEGTNRFNFLLYKLFQNVKQVGVMEVFIANPYNFTEDFVSSIAVELDHYTAKCKTDAITLHRTLVLVIEKKISLIFKLCMFVSHT